MRLVRVLHRSLCGATDAPIVFLCRGVAVSLLGEDIPPLLFSLWLPGLLFNLLAPASFLLRYGPALFLFLVGVIHRSLCGTSDAPIVFL